MSEEPGAVRGWLEVLGEFWTEKVRWYHLYAGALAVAACVASTGWTFPEYLNADWSRYAGFRRIIKRQSPPRPDVSVLYIESSISTFMFIY